MLGLAFKAAARYVGGGAAKYLGALFTKHPVAAPLVLDITATGGEGSKFIGRKIGEKLGILSTENPDGSKPAGPGTSLLSGAYNFFTQGWTLEKAIGTGIGVLAGGLLGRALGGDGMLGTLLMVTLAMAGAYLANNGGIFKGITNMFSAAADPSARQEVAPALRSDRPAALPSLDMGGQ